MAKRAQMSPDDIADKQIRRAQGAVTDYKNGIQAVTDNPMLKAAAAQDKWLQGVQDAHSNGTFAAGCQSVSLADWQQAAVQKGGATYSQGVSNSRAKIVDFQTQRQSAQSQIDSALAAMPRGDLSQNIQRMVTQATMMSNFKFKKRRKS